MMRIVTALALLTLMAGTAYGATKYEAEYAFTHKLQVRRIPGHKGAAAEFDDKGFWIIVDEGAYLFASWKEIDAASVACRGKLPPGGRFI